MQFYQWLGLELKWQQRGKEGTLTLKMNQRLFSVKSYINTHYTVCGAVAINSLALPGTDDRKDSGVKDNRV